MRVPFRALHLVPSSLCFDPSCASHVLHEPIVHRELVLDAIGIEQAFDLRLTQGFYLFVASFVFVRYIQGVVRDIAPKKRP